MQSFHIEGHILYESHQDCRIYVYMYRVSSGGQVPRDKKLNENLDQMKLSLYAVRLERRYAASL